MNITCIYILKSDHLVFYWTVFVKMSSYSTLVSLSEPKTPALLSFFSPFKQTFHIHGIYPYIFWNDFLSYYLLVHLCILSPQTICIFFREHTSYLINVCLSMPYNIVA